MNEMITVNTNRGEDKMTVNEFSRWACLAEAFYFLEKKADELNVDLYQLIKPNAIEKYINERYESVRHDVEIEHGLGLL